MGIFSRTEKIPKPYIIFQIDDGCKGLLRPGSQVTGLVTAQSPVQRNLRSARIIFTGRASTHAYRRESSGAGSNRHTRTIHYADEAELFNIDQFISPEASLDSDIPYTFRFAFEFPGHTADVLAESPYAGNKSSSRQIYRETGHELPPTYAYESSSDSFAKVEYALQAEFVFEDALDKPILTLPIPLIFCPMRPLGEFNALVEHTLPTKSYSSSRLIGEEKSVMHSIRDAFSGNTPSLMVHMKCSLPSHFTPGANFTIYACVELDSFSQDDISVPAITLRCKSLKLYPTTFWRALRVHTSNRSEAERDNIGEVLLNAVPGEMVVKAKQDEYAKGRFGYPAAFEARIPGDMCPSFATFNVVHAYSFKVVLEAEVRGKRFELKGEGTVILLPG